ncbi:Mesoderm induction early response protein 1 [Bagarius yarrelli]|uniref:Mesoderm induction early response protein 1 n=1 Tax=Bagarius yarrelli TaxID=175774 RepID=A0A556TY09_BAGYA|nr:Mesoderm induction early response protein 1 [Bagarius yarrelli]
MRDEDGDFEPTADMLVHDFDDEQTLEEEEMLQGETNFSSEIDDLTREGEMPLHELLKMYGYGAAESADTEDEGPEEQDVSENEQSSSGHGNIKTNKEDKADENQRSSLYENEDQLLWNPELLPENEVVEFLAEASKRVGGQTEVDAVPETPLIKDNEEALYELIQCNFNKEEALKRLKFNPKPVKDELPVWAQEESREFERDDGVCGNDFNSVQADKIKLWRRKPDLLSSVTNSTEQTSTESVRTEVSREAVSPTEASNYNSHQLASETSSTTHSGSDSHSVDYTPSCGSDRTTSNTQVLSSPDSDLSGSTMDAVRRPREDEEDSERPVKKQKTEMEFRTVAAV